MKRLIAALTAFAMLNTAYLYMPSYDETECVPFTAVAESSDFDMEAVPHYKGSKTDVVVPSEINGKVIEYIDSDFFPDTITSVTLPDTISSIGYTAFREYTNLKKINFPNSIKNVLYRAFERCNGLSSVDITGDGVYIDVAAFYECKGLTEVNLTGVENIASYAFWQCSSLKKINLSDSLKHIGNKVFYNSAVTELTIPDSVTGIGEYSFANCLNLSSVKLSSSLEYIDNYLFEDCKNLTEINIPDSVKYIGHNAFSRCSKLSSVTIPDSVESIKGLAFNWCTSLTNVIIPDSVTEIEYYAFCGCSNLKSITIPDSVTKIGDGVFDYCNKDLVIKGYSNSAAERYAKENNIQFSALADEPSYSYGDINGDCTIDGIDASLILTEYAVTSAGGNKTLNAKQSAFADINKDGVLDATDASCLLTYYAVESVSDKHTSLEDYVSSISESDNDTATSDNPDNNATDSAAEFTGFRIEDGKKYYYYNGYLYKNMVTPEYIIDSDGVWHSYIFAPTGNQTEDARKIAQVIAECAGEGTDKERVIQAASIVCVISQYSEYLLYGNYFYTAYGTFIKREATCDGITAALGMVLECMGFEWKYANYGKVAHKWCILNMDGQLGYADCFATNYFNIDGVKPYTSQCYVGYGHHTQETYFDDFSHIDYSDVYYLWQRTDMYECEFVAE
ncbi:MAG: leucine-rich repeat protein [Ruminococcus sp.]|nr:leucine-rich repeat protein [Ruminococcus sp.]